MRLTELNGQARNIITKTEVPLWVRIKEGKTEKMKTKFKYEELAILHLEKQGFDVDKWKLYGLPWYWKAYLYPVIWGIKGEVEDAVERLVERGGI